MAAKSDDPADIEKQVVNKWPVTTGAGGHAKFDFAVPSEGQYRVAFEADDGWQQTVTSETTVWVLGPNFYGSQYRFAGVEVIPDKRTYRVGETAKLLINTSQPNARLLAVNTMDEHSFIDIPDHSKVVEIPITARHVPNFFFCATVVHNGQVFNESCEVYVPPVDDILNVELLPDQETYKPGQTGDVKIKVTDADGNPVSGSMALTAFDKALTYIQQDSGTGPKSLIAERRTRYWNSGVSSTLGTRKFEVSGKFVCPEFHLEDGSEPRLGGMGGAAPTGGDPSDASGDGSQRARRAAPDIPSNMDQFVGGLIEPKIRADFSDSAIWLPDLTLDELGSASAEVTFPESLTTWRVRGYLVTRSTQIGDAICEVKTNKDLLVRLQAPRFFVEDDEVVLSANTHNYLPDDKVVSAELIVPADLFDAMQGQVDDAYDSLKQDDQGNRHLIQSAFIQSGKAHRFDWRVKVKTDGLATITVKAITDVESDAMQMAFPVQSRGIVETKSLSEYFLSDETGNKEINFELPNIVDTSKTKIELTMAPSAAGVAFDALPFLAGYPYGCVEQTMSRFYPTVLAADTLNKLGTDIEAVAKNVAERNLLRPNRRSRRTPLFDSIELRRMSDAGLNRLYRFQHQDGGWGWWQHDSSSSYMTAYVLLGLNTAADAGVHVADRVYERGVRYLLRSLDDHLPNTSKSRKNERALIAYVLSLERSGEGIEQREAIRKLVNTVYSERASLNHYGRALLALALNNQEMKDKAKEVLREILHDVDQDEKLDISWIPTPQQEWWRWQNSDIETNAWTLRALIAIDLDEELASGLVNWLVANRRHGNYWRSTRDSALAVHALAEYLLVMRQGASDYSVAIHLDGKHVKDVQVSWQKMLEMENRLLLPAEGVKPGQHQITIVKNDEGPLHFSMVTEYLTKHDRIPEMAAGGLHIQRRYFRLPAGSAPDVDDENASNSVDKTVMPLEAGDVLAIGDSIEVELTITAEEEFEYLAFEDPKPAGCEPIRLRSGYGGSRGLYANVELMDEKVVFFVGRLRSGEHILRYKLRAEVPGKFSALPATGFAMYAPEIRARSSENQLTIQDLFK